jgi:O-acetyl-ADP-ribose deacetylase (regulator of RNase III)
MPFEILRNDITKMKADAIVNTANPRPVIGSGVDSMLHQAAGPELLKARQAIGSIAVGEAAVTEAFALQARFVIHTVGPVWQGGGCGEEALLRRCYDNALRLAAERKCRSIAFPLISSGNYGFPKDKALQVAIAAFSAFLLENDMQIYLVVFDRTAYRLSEQLFQGVASYIDQHYVDSCELATYGAAPRRGRRRLERCMEVCESMAMPRPSMSLEDFLKAKDSGFTQRLRELILEKGLKNSAVYKRANISKQLFSKIINDPDARPTKPTAIALALALELDLEGTRDLIGRAGYALTNSSTFDLIIRYFIERKQYNVVEINIALYEFDQSLLGAG